MMRMVCPSALRTFSFPALPYPMRQRSRRRKVLVRVGATLLLALAVGAAKADTAPASDGVRYEPAMEPDPLADPRAIPGGRIRIFAGAAPKSLNYLLDNNSFTAQVFGMMFESLLSGTSLSPDHAPGLARAWTVSGDGRTFTFEIDPAARWSDGRPVTAEDVCWTFHKIVEPGSLAGAFKMELETFDEPTALEPLVVRVTARETHWRNLGAFGGMPVLPKHVFETNEFNRIHFDFPVVSGPYRLGPLRENVSLELIRRPDWWAATRPQNLHTLNFGVLDFRFYAERENAFEAFRKGEIDIFPIYTARIWAQEIRGERFDRNWIVRQAVRNHSPVGFQGFAMNMRRPPYDDVRVRKALALLLDRAALNRTLMFNQYFLHRSYYEDLYDANHPCANPEIPYDPAEAARLLDEAGWTTDPKTGFRQRGGVPLVVRFLTRDSTTDKFLAVYREALRGAGIRLEVVRKDLAAWFRDMDAYNFEMTWAAWGAGLYKDPESLWYSKEADRPSGNNITGFGDPRVDELIDAQRAEFDVAKRHEICRQIDAILAEACPYVLLWNADSTRLLYWNRFGVPRTVLSKYGHEDGAISYWWFDPDSDADLADAMATGRSLPRRPPEVRFDDVFQPTSSP